MVIVSKSSSNSHMVPYVEQHGPSRQKKNLPGGGQESREKKGPQTQQNPVNQFPFTRSLINDPVTLSDSMGWSNSSFSLVMINYHEQKQLKEETILAQGFRELDIHNDGKACQQGREVGRSHLYSHQGAKCKLEVDLWGEVIQRKAPMTYFRHAGYSSVKFHSYPKQRFLARTKCANT